MAQAVAIGGLRIYVTADLSATPTNNSTLQFSLPVYADAGADGLATSNGDVGVFIGSTNDGPTDSAILNAASQVIDTAAPTLSEQTPVPAFTSDTTPNYAFTSSEAGTIAYAGDCSSATTAASAGVNTVTFNSLAAGLHNNCTVRVTDSAGNQSTLLTVSAFTIDITAPTVAQVTPVPPNTNDATPDYTFNSTEAGSLTYGGDCASSTLAAVNGSNTVTFNALGQGLHNNCTVRVTDDAGNPSNLLAVTAFIVDTDEPILAEVTPVPPETNDATPSYTFASTEAGAITYGGSCSSITTSAVAGNNTVTFNFLADGTYADCTLRVTDTAGNPSLILTVSTFRVHTHAPHVLNVTALEVNGTYGPGQSVHVTITFDEALYVTGTPRLLLETGTTDRYAGYESGSATDTLLFDYYVQSGDEALDLDYVSINALELNGGTIKDSSTNDAALTLPAPGSSGSLGDNKSIVIVPSLTDTEAPFVSYAFSSTANGVYVLGATINVTLHWNETIVITGTPQLTLNTSPNQAIINYVGGSGSHYLSFTYIVGADQVSADLDYASINALSLNGGTIKDLVGNDAALTLAAPGSGASLAGAAAIVVDSVDPIISETTPVPTYTNDVTPSYSFNASEAGTILYGGDCSSVTTAAMAGSNTITFNTLADGSHSNCTLQLRDVANNLSAVLAVSAFTIDTIPPRVINVSSSAANDRYGIGAALAIQVSFDTPAMLVTGTPQLTLETGASDAVAPYQGGAGTSTLTFLYTVAAGQNSSRLDYLNSSAVTLNGGTITGQAGNPAVLSLPAPGAAGSLGANKNIVIHTIPPVVVEITPVFTPTADTTPNYVFNSTEAGTITYGGDCVSTTTTAVVGDNAITFLALGFGLHNNCTIRVTDPEGNVSALLAISAFTVESQGGRVHLILQSLGLGLHKSAEPPALKAEHDAVVYRYTVHNHGLIHLHNIRLTDDSCAPVQFDGGDTNGDDALDVEENWHYSCRTRLATSTTNIAMVTGEHNGSILTDTAELFVPVAEGAEPSSIHLEKSSLPALLPAEGGEVTFTYKVIPFSDVHLTEVGLQDPLCQPLVYVTGDTDGDQMLDSHEVWHYSCAMHITKTTENHATVTALARGQQIRDEATTLVRVEQPGIDVHQEDQPKEGIALFEHLGLPVHALVKTPANSTVYYLGADGLAHAFLNEQVFFTWECDFNRLSIVSEVLLAQVPVGSNITFAPGIKMLKRPTDPKVYAIEAGSVLRWIKNEQVAQDLYGQAWNKNIVDVPSFDGYTLGAEITRKADFDPMTVRKSVTHPSDVLHIPGYTPSPPGQGLICQRS